MVERFACELNANNNGVDALNIYILPLISHPRQTNKPSLQRFPLRFDECKCTCPHRSLERRQLKAIHLREFECGLTGRAPWFLFEKKKIDDSMSDPIKVGDVRTVENPGNIGRGCASRFAVERFVTPVADRSVLGRRLHHWSGS